MSVSPQPYQYGIVFDLWIFADLIDNILSVVFISLLFVNEVDPLILKDICIYIWSWITFMQWWLWYTAMVKVVIIF